MSHAYKKFFRNDDEKFAWQKEYSNNDKINLNKPSIYDNIQLDSSSSKKNFLSQSVRPNFDYDLEDIYDTNNYTNKVKTKTKDKDDYFNMSKKNTINNKNNISNINDIAQPINRDLNSIITSTIGLSNLGNTCFMNTCLHI